MPLEKFQNLRVWQEARALAVLVYRLTKDFPPEERFGLAGQMRRAGISVSSNIAEGSKKRSVRDRAHFHEIADSSLEELKSQALVALELDFLPQTSVDEILIQARKVGGMLGSLTQKL